jgi:hypothetical protein
VTVDHLETHTTGRGRAVKRRSAGTWVTRATQRLPHINNVVPLAQR